jgi:putative inorganic carbon (HCO3(-)) transporter
LKRIAVVLNRYIVYIISFAFIALNLWFVSKDIMLLGLLPLAVIFIFIALYRLDTLLLITVFLVPLSLPLIEFYEDLSFNLLLPTELLLIGILFIVLLKRIKGETLDKNLLSHPVTIVIYFNLAWILVTSFTSSMALVSFKFFISRLWFVIAFYFLAAEIFRKPRNMARYMWAYVLSLLMVIGYTFYRHFSIGLFNQEAAHYVMNPFYNDHTSYGAILAMFIPVVIGFVSDNSRSIWYRLFSFMVLAVLITAIILSYSRAAWISLVFVVVIFIVVMLRIRFHVLLIAVAVFLVLIFNRIDDITHQMEMNRKESSANLTEHLQSISNITSDDSNMERLNRWSCAWRMFLQKPVFGWGPGTYMFQYAPFQVVREKTLISTNMADKGNAHSEYLGPLSESGLFGMLSFVAIVVTTLITGFSTYWKLKDRRYKIILLSAILGLITYYIHGILNNFLDTDKASAPFWGFTAIIVSLAIYSKKEKEDNNGKLTVPEGDEKDKSLK